MGTLNLGSGSLNLTGNLAVSQLHTNTLRHSDGVTKHTPVQVTTKGGSTIITNINWGGSYNNTYQDLGSLATYTTANTYAVTIDHFVQFAGAANSHTYLTGYLYQKGKNYVTHGTYTYQLHYDWYYNATTTPIIVPWDPDGDQTLSMYVTYAHNTSATGNPVTYPSFQGFFINAIHERVL